jgi:hypothetical protein
MSGEDVVIELSPGCTVTLEKVPGWERRLKERTAAAGRAAAEAEKNWRPEPRKAPAPPPPVAQKAIGEIDLFDFEENDQ